MKEMKDMTSHVRQKSDLKDKIAYYREKLPVAELAVANITGLLNENEDASLEKYLQGILADWQKQLTFMQSELQSAELQLEKLEASEASLAEASQSYLKSFFQKRGLYLTQAILVVFVILLLSRMSYRAMARLIPGYRKEYRSFRLRLARSDASDDNRLPGHHRTDGGLLCGRGLGAFHVLASCCCWASV